jgi:hypothetical protein
MLDPLPSYKELGSRFWDYAFACPVGSWRARLDCKAWGKQRNILLYFSELGTEKKHCISVFDVTHYTAADRRIDFRREGQPGDLFELQTSKTRTGRTRFLSAEILAQPENAEAAVAGTETLTPVS